MCLKVHCNHETPNQSLNCGTLGKRRRLWVTIPYMDRMGYIGSTPHPGYQSPEGLLHL